MNRVLALTVKGQDIKGMEVVKRGSAATIASLIKDNQGAAAYKGRSLPVVAVLSSPVFIKSIRLRKDQMRSKRTIQEFILQKPPFPLRDSKYDWFLSGNILTLFVAKTKDVENSLTRLAALNIQPTLVTSKAACLYNHFMYHYPNKKSGFCLLYFARDFLDMLTFANGRFFFYEIPLQNAGQDPQILKNALQELNRQREYLQFQENIDKEHFSETFVCGDFAADAVDTLAEGLGAEVQIVEHKADVGGKYAENLAGFKDELCVLFGASRAALDKSALQIDFIREERYKNLLNVYKERLVKFAAFLSVAALVFLAAMSILLLNRIIINQGTLRSHEKIVKKLTPLYTELDIKKKELLEQTRPLEKQVLEHNFLIEALSLVDSLRGEVEIEGFSFTRNEELELSLDVKALAYDEISQFLKNLRESGFFAKIVPVSSRPGQKSADVKEEVLFKIKLIK